MVRNQHDNVSKRVRDAIDTAPLDYCIETTEGVVRVCVTTDHLHLGVNVVDLHGQVAAFLGQVQHLYGAGRASSWFGSGLGLGLQLGSLLDEGAGWDRVRVREILRGRGKCGVVLRRTGVGYRSDRGAGHCAGEGGGSPDCG